MKGSLPPSSRFSGIVRWSPDTPVCIPFSRMKEPKPQGKFQLMPGKKEKKRKGKEYQGRRLLESHEIRSNWYLICRNSWFGARIFAILKLGGYKIAIQWFARNCKKYIIHKTICYLRFPNFSSRPAVLAARRSHCPNLATKISESNGFDAPTIHAHCTLS